MNDIQYVSMVTDDGEKARKFKCGVKKNHYLYLKRGCSWEELKELVLRGCTVGRVGKFSEFIAIDIDDSEITHEAMQLWAAGYNSAHGDCVLATPSRSGIWYKHHVYFKVPEYQVEDHFKVFTECFHEITKHFGGIRVRYDKSAAKYYQCMFQTGEPGQFTLPGSVQLAQWCKKDHVAPVPYIATVEAADDEEWHVVDESDDSEPDYPADGRAVIPNDRNYFFNLAAMSGIPPKEFATLPFTVLQGPFARKGSRHATMLKIADALVRNAALMGFFGMSVRDEDVKRTLEQHIRAHFEDGEQYLKEDVASIANAITSLHDSYAKGFASTDRSYDALKQVLGAGYHRYSIKAFANAFIRQHQGDIDHTWDLDDTCITIVDAYNGYPEEYIATEFHKMLSQVRNTIRGVFELKKTIRIEKDLDEARRVYDLTNNIQLFPDMPATPMTFEEFCERSTAGDKLVVSHYNEPIGRKEHKRHSNKGRCGGYEVVNGTLVVPKDKVTPYIRSYCGRNGIKLLQTANE